MRRKRLVAAVTDKQIGDISTDWISVLFVPHRELTNISLMFMRPNPMATPTVEATTTASADQGHKRGSGTEKKIPAMMTALTDRIQALETSQISVEEDDQ